MCDSEIITKSHYLFDCINCPLLLFQEVNQLSCVRDVLGRSAQVATNVGNILDSFEHRLARLETTILPLYQQTGNLQRRQLSKW